MSSEVVPQNIKNIIKDITKSENEENYSIQLQDANQKGEGFMGELVFISIIDNNTKKPVLHLALKNAFQDLNIRTIHPIRNLFLNEIYFYKTIWPTFNAFKKLYNIEKPIAKLANYYGSNTKNGEESIILENLKSSGYDMFDKKKFLSKEQFKFIFKRYGKLHGLFYAFKKQNPEKYSEITEQIRPGLEQTLKAFETPAINVIQKIYNLFASEEDKDVRKAFEKYRDHGWDIVTENSRYDGQNGILIHGDSWNNNMMFKQDSEGNFTDMALIDFQLIRVGSPVHDIGYCFYTGATKPILDSLDELLHDYHDSLADTLSDFGENVEEIYPFSVLQEEWKKYAKYGMLFSFLIWSVRTRSTEEVYDTAELSDVKNQEILKSKPLNKVYSVIVADIIRHMYSIDAL